MKRPVMLGAHAVTRSRTKGGFVRSMGQRVNHERARRAAGEFLNRRQNTLWTPANPP